MKQGQPQQPPKRLLPRNWRHYLMVGAIVFGSVGAVAAVTKASYEISKSSYVTERTAPKPATKSNRHQNWF